MKTNETDSGFRIYESPEVTVWTLVLETAILQASTGTFNGGGYGHDNVDTI